MAPRTSLDVVPRGEYSSSGWSLRKVLVSPPQDRRSDTTETTTRLIEGQIHDTAVLDDYLRKIDAINMIAQVHVSIGALIAEAGAHGGSLTSQQIAIWLADRHVHTLAGDLAPLVIPAPHAPKKDFRFFVRHTLGPWTPAFWASVYAAIKKGDLDVYLYGPEAVSYRTIMKIKSQAEGDIRRLSATMDAARHRLNMFFYHVKI